MRFCLLGRYALVDKAIDKAATEADHQRVAALAVQRVWVRATGHIMLILVAACFAAFLVLVMADLTQTLLDTATNTRIMAERQ